MSSTRASCSSLALVSALALVVTEVTAREYNRAMVHYHRKKGGVRCGYGIWAFHDWRCTIVHFFRDVRSEGNPSLLSSKISLSLSIIHCNVSQEVHDTKMSSMRSSCSSLALVSALALVATEVTAREYNNRGVVASFLNYVALVHYIAEQSCHSSGLTRLFWVFLFLLLLHYLLWAIGTTALQLQFP